MIYPLFKPNLTTEIHSFTEKIRTFPIQADQLINIGLNGKKLGDVMKIMKKEFIESDFSLSGEKLLEIAKKYKSANKPLKLT